jgi:hypothetical protein
MKTIILSLAILSFCKPVFAADSTCQDRVAEIANWGRQDRFEVRGGRLLPTKEAKFKNFDAGKLVDGNGSVTFTDTDGEKGFIEYVGGRVVRFQVVNNVASSAFTLNSDCAIDQNYSGSEINYDRQFCSALADVIDLPSLQKANECAEVFEKVDLALQKRNKEVEPRRLYAAGISGSGLAKYAITIAYCADLGGRFPPLNSSYGGKGNATVFVLKNLFGITQRASPPASTAPRPTKQ